MLSIMVPAYNEELYLLTTVNSLINVAALNNLKLEIIIVNDGSSDNTQKIIDDLRENHQFIKCITNKVNLGQGRSLIKVLKIVTGDKFLIVAGDGDITDKDLSSLFQNINRAEMVFLYFLNRELRGRFRNIISMVYNIFHLLIFNVYIQYVSGPCIYPTERIKKIKINSKRTSFVAEITIKILLQGGTYHEIAGQMQRGKVGSSSISIKNLFDVITSFLRLFFEVKVLRRDLYSKLPTRL